MTHNAYFTRLITILFFIIVVCLFGVKPADAAVLILDPTTKSSPPGVNFPINLNIDTEGEQVTSADAIITFDNTILEVSAITNGTFFPDVFQNISPGSIYIGASVIEPTDTRTGTGTIAVIQFRGKNNGVSDVKFDCTAGKTSDSNISKNDKNATDIIKCESLVSGRYTIGSGIGQPALTTAPGIPTATPIRAGSADTTMGIVTLGLVFMIIGTITGVTAIVKRET